MDYTALIINIEGKMNLLQDLIKALHQKRDISMVIKTSLIHLYFMAQLLKENIPRMEYDI